MVLFKHYVNIKNNSYCSVDSPGFEPCCGQDFMDSEQPHWPTQPPLQWK